MIDLGLPSWLGILYSALFGTIVGSYLNVVVYRLPRGRSTWKPRSRCPGCERNIAWFDNVPVLSYIALRGRCRHCKAQISARYPIVEASTGLLFGLAFWRFQWTIDTPIAFLFFSLLLSLALIDAEHFLLPDAITLPGLLLGLLLAIAGGNTGAVSAGLGALFGAGILLFLIAAYYLLRGELGMGLGDPKMLAMIGAFVGLPKTILTVFIASLAGSILSLMLMLGGRMTRQTKLPFGVYLALGAVLALLFGDPLVNWYLGGPLL